MRIVTFFLIALSSLTYLPPEAVAQNIEKEFEYLNSKPNSTIDAMEFREVMLKAAGIGHGAAEIIGTIPTIEALEPGSNYVHNTFDSDETSGSTILSPWRAYKSGPLYFQIDHETCRVRKMNYVRPWSTQSKSTLLFDCYDTRHADSYVSRRFSIAYVSSDHNEILEIQANLNGPIGTRKTIRPNGVLTY